MIEFLRLILHIMASFFKPRTKLVAEILILRQQLNVLRRQVSKRPQLSNTDRFLFVWLYRWFPSVLSAIAILRPETIIRWHRAGFQSYWRERSREPVGRPRISAELRNLIGAMSRANHLWLPRTQIRAYRWCNPPRIGCAIMSPNRSIGRVQGASLPSERCVRISL